MPRKTSHTRGTNPVLQEALRRFKAEFFQALSHPTRIHIVETLRDGPLPVSEILKNVPVEPANLSQHLSLLRAKGVVSNRKEGSQIYYSLRDPMLIQILDILRSYFQSHLEEVLQMLKGL